MTRVKLACGTLFLLLLNVCIVFATAPEADFDAANRLYEQGKFPEAVSAYEKIVREGTHSPALYFNLGNAFFKAGKTGQALAAYQKAENLSPRDPDLRASLRFVRSQVQGISSPPDRWETWLRRLTVNEWTAVAAVPFWLLLLLLSAAQLKPRLKQSLRLLTWLAGFGTVAAIICLLAALKGRSEPTVIVTAEEAVVRTGPLDESQNAFTVHDGAELRVLDQKDEWLQVSADNRLGWLKREQVTPGGD